MKDNSSFGIIIILGIIAIALFGGNKNSSSGGLLSPGKTTTKTVTTEQKQAEIRKEIKKTQQQVEDLKKKIQLEEDKKTKSKYNGLVKMSQVNRSTNPKSEYVVISVSTSVKTPIPVSGWTLKSLNSGTSVTIPNGTYLFFTGMQNAEENIYLNGGEILYLVTGISPNGSSFKVNKCSGYLTQFQTFVPYMSTSCPRPRDEDLSGIPKLTINDACFDYIDQMPQCRIQTKTLPIKWSYECKNFIYEKINYPSCVNTHKNDPDFYKKEWRVYLKRSERLWKDRREDIVLYDLEGKIVSELKY